MDENQDLIRKRPAADRMGTENTHPSKNREGWGTRYPLHKCRIQI
jgi:hypothetical protein